MTQPLFTARPGTVYFIGAGPGAPDLITVRGKEIIARADLILYADSLVEASVANLARRPQARIVGSSGLHLEQILALMVDTARAGGIVARLHSGDPALYGATHEQMAHLEDHEVPYEIVPGVTAVFAAAARLKVELTIPDLVQSLILTRTAGRTTMPAGENLRDLAAPGASLAIYLSISRIRRVVDDLLASGGYGPETPVAVLHKVTWPDESFVLGTLADIGDKVRQAGYTKHALILVSPALEASLKDSNRRTSSHLYDKGYTHRFRRAENFRRGKERREAAGAVKGVAIGDKHLGADGHAQGAVVIAITRRGSQLAAQLAPALTANLSIPTKFAHLVKNHSPSTPNQETPTPLSSLLSPLSTYSDSALTEVRRRWSKHRSLVLVMPTGVAVRAIAPLIGHKSTDPAVVCLDEAGQTVIPLLGGHQAGANELARQIAAMTGGYAAITTASDLQGKPALDLPPVGADGVGAGRAWHIDPASALTHTSACLVNDEPIGVYVDPALETVRQEAADWLGQAENLTWVKALDDLDLDSYPAGLIITSQLLSDHHRHLLRKSICYAPPVLVVGLGCRRGVPMDELQAALKTTLAGAGLNPAGLAALATIDLKADEPGLTELASALNVPLHLVEREELAAAFPPQEAGTWADFSPSAAQEKFNLPGVAEPCALLAAGPDSRLIVPKRSFARCTVAVSLKG